MEVKGGAEVRRQTILDILSPDNEPTPEEASIIGRTYKYLKNCPNVEVTSGVEAIVRYIAHRLVGEYNIDTAELTTADTDSLLGEIQDKFLLEKEGKLYQCIHKKSRTADTFQ